MRVIIGPILPGYASPPGCGASSKVRVWQLVVMDSIAKALGPAVVRRAGGQKKPHVGTAPRQFSPGEGVLPVPSLVLWTRSPRNKENPSLLGVKEYSPSLHSKR